MTIERFILMLVSIRIEERGGYRLGEMHGVSRFETDVEVELGEEEEGGGAGGQDGDESAGDGALARAVDGFGEDVVRPERHGGW